MKTLPVIALALSSVLLVGCNSDNDSKSSGNQEPEGPQTTWYEDKDGDGYGDPSSEFVGDQPDNTWVENDDDCDDDATTGAAINPDADELNTDKLDTNCDGIFSVAPFTVGQTGPAGGVIFETDGTNGLEASPVDLLDGNVAQWGCSGTDITGANNVNNGSQNTADIIAAQCSASTQGVSVAANAANDYTVNGHDDWFLPSRSQLQTLYTQRQHLDSYFAGYYWSSSESTATVAWGVGLHNGVFSYAAKTLDYRVRAIRSF